MATIFTTMRTDTMPYYSPIKAGLGLFNLPHLLSRQYYNNNGSDTRKLTQNITY